AGLLLVSTFRYYRYRVGAHYPIQDVILCGAMLAFAVAHYRLQSLQSFLFPRDPRRPANAGARGAERGAQPPAPRAPRAALRDHRRPARVVSPEELVFFLMVVFFWAGLAPFCYPALLASDYPPQEYDAHWWGRIDDSTGRTLAGGLEVLVEGVWRLSGALWLIGGGALLVASLLGHLAHRRLSPAEATLFLQDAVWKETRREQRRLNRWLAWARLRRRGQRAEVR